MAPPLSEKSPSLGAWQKRSLHHLLQKTDTFIHCVELVTSRGIITERSGRRVLELARNLAQHPEVHGLSHRQRPGLPGRLPGRPP